MNKWFKTNNCLNLLMTKLSKTNFDTRKNTDLTSSVDREVTAVSNSGHSENLKLSQINNIIKVVTTARNYQNTSYIIIFSYCAVFIGIQDGHGSCQQIPHEKIILSGMINFCASISIPYSNMYQLSSRTLRQGKYINNHIRFD